jgi:hypothetical protein
MKTKTTNNKSIVNIWHLLIIALALLCFAHESQALERNSFPINPGDPKSINDPHYPL